MPGDCPLLTQRPAKQTTRESAVGRALRASPRPLAFRPFTVGQRRNRPGPSRGVPGATRGTKRSAKARSCIPGSAPGTAGTGTGRSDRTGTGRKRPPRRMAGEPPTPGQGRETLPVSCRTRPPPTCWAGNAVRLRAVVSPMRTSGHGDPDHWVAAAKVLRTWRSGRRLLAGYAVVAALVLWPLFCWDHRTSDLYKAMAAMMVVGLLLLIMVTLRNDWAASALADWRPELAGPADLAEDHRLWQSGGFGYMTGLLMPKSATTRTTPRRSETVLSAPRSSWSPSWR
jgi:hypothetical protein